MSLVLVTLLGSSALSPPVTAGANRLTRLAGVSLLRASDGSPVELVPALEAASPSLLVLGTYPADFNMIEYLQKLRHYLPEMESRGIGRTLVAVNGSPASCTKLSTLLDLPASIELLSDPSGEAGRLFGVSRGWQPEAEFNPYAKLFGMLLGLGAVRTLPSVIAGYIGNPWGANAWIETALAQGQCAGRWPDVALTLEGNTVQRNAFDELPLVGGWGRRPLELATLRLQTMLGISVQHWSELQPTDERTLTQLGGCMLVKDGEPTFVWLDDGICHTANFEDLLKVM